MDTLPAVTNENGLLYSWGWGKQSLHDDDQDRLPESLMESSQNEQMSEELLVTSRLSSKTILAVSTGQHHSACATAQGTLYVVGTNLHGCVDPDLEDEMVCPKPVLLDSLGQIRVVQVSCGFDHTAALSSNGSVITWGGNAFGQLGHRSNNRIKVNLGDGPVHIRPAGMVLGKGRRASAIACGAYFTMVLTTRRSLLVCGTPNIAGYRDDSEFGSLKEMPSLVGLPLVGMSAGDSHAAVVTAHGTALVWGKNQQGCCGREYPDELALPVPVKVVTESKDETASQPLPFANWELTKQSDGITVKLADDVAIQHAACGYAHTILVTRSGRLLVFGDNGRGQLGTIASDKPTTTALPVQHPRGGRFVSAEAGNAHSILLDSSGDVWLTTPSGLKCLLEGKSVLAIAAGGDDNAVAIASPPTGALMRQFSVDSNEDGSMIVDQVETLLDEMDSDSANKVSAGYDIAKRTEELLRYVKLSFRCMMPLLFHQV
jgi:alpha-tubulin suppressor-like RCC1 family protein